MTDVFAELVDPDTLDWVPLDPTTSYKLLWVNELTGGWTMLVRARAGAVNHAHRHLGPADFLVLSGSIEYRNGRAGPGAWVYEPAGAVHETTSHPDDTVYLANVHGPLAFYASDGSISAVIDGFSFRAQLAASAAERGLRMVAGPPDRPTSGTGA